MMHACLILWDDVLLFSIFLIILALYLCQMLEPENRPPYTNSKDRETWKTYNGFKNSSVFAGIRHVELSWKSKDRHFCEWNQAFFFKFHFIVRCLIIRPKDMCHKIDPSTFIGFFTAFSWHGKAQKYELKDLTPGCYRVTSSLKDTLREIDIDIKNFIAFSSVWKRCP